MESHFRFPTLPFPTPCTHISSKGPPFHQSPSTLRSWLPVSDPICSGRLKLSRGVAGALKNADDLQRLRIGQVNHHVLPPHPAKTGRVRASSPNVGDQDAVFSQAARMLHRYHLLACQLRLRCRWRYKPRFPGGRLSPLATVRIPSLKVTILLPLFFECSHLSLDLLCWNGTTGAD